MIFCGRQLIEKAIEHISVKLMILSHVRPCGDFFVKYGVPPSMLSVIHSLHDGMKAEVTVDGQVAPDFEVSNGLRQLLVVLVMLSDCLLSYNEEKLSVFQSLSIWCLWSLVK